MIDLHTHSTCSDGTCTPTEVVQQAKKAGVSVLALTDHDTVSGIEEAQKEAKTQGIKFISGIELSIERDFGEFHLLGYGMDIYNKHLTELIAKSASDRDRRNIKICEMLKKESIQIDYEELKKKYTGMIGRPHFAKFLKEQNKVSSTQEAFDKYFAYNRPFFLKTPGVNFNDAVWAIKQAGGVPVIAHPMSLYLSWAKLPDEIKKLKKDGLIGLEAWNAGTRAGSCRRLEALAKSLGLIATAGSDFHGKNKVGHQLGRKITGEPIDDYFYTENLATVLIQD
ncbi:MAG: phosphatase [Treponema sp.]|nr:MAG: phosphatase [Treponema sp.]